MPSPARLIYSVIATLPDEATCEEYVTWLTEGHVQAVLVGGAEACEVVRFDTSSEQNAIEVESRYHFGSRQAFDAYERQHAPALREDGLRRFGDRGIAFTRRVGQCVPFGDS